MIVTPRPRRDENEHLVRNSLLTPNVSIILLLFCTHEQASPRNYEIFISRARLFLTPFLHDPTEKKKGIFVLCGSNSKNVRNNGETKTRQSFSGLGFHSLSGCCHVTDKKMLVKVLWDSIFCKNPTSV